MAHQILPLHPGKFNGVFDSPGRNSKMDEQEFKKRLCAALDAFCMEVSTGKRQPGTSYQIDTDFTIQVLAVDRIRFAVYGEVIEFDPATVLAGVQEAIRS
jgi:hypothetical protein